MTASAAQATRGARVLRGLAAATVATSAAAASHSLSGGTVSLVGLTVAATFAAIVCIAFAGRSLSTARLATSVLLSQLAFHLAFSAIGTGDTIMRMGHHDAMIVATDVAGSTPAGLQMWLGHAVAALATIVLLRNGESAFWRLRELVRFAVAIWAFVLPEVPHPAARPPELSARPRLFLLRRAALKYRGPPTISSTIRFV